jgi:membrane-associated phospholipid phosphatase
MDWIQAADEAVLLFIQEYIRVDVLNGFWKAVTFLADKGWFWLGVSFLLLFFKRTSAAGAASLVSIAICFCITNLVLKGCVARPRPDAVMDAIVPLIRTPRDYSFPSGHTTVSFAGALVCYRMLPRRYGIPALVLAGLIGFSRLYLGVHFPSDVLGGFLVALAGSGVSVKVLAGKADVQ